MGLREKRVHVYVSQLPCLVCGRYGVDVAHWPRRRSQGASSGLLEVIPLCRMHHRLADEGSAVWGYIITNLAEEFHGRMIRCYNDDVMFLGPQERVEEVWKTFSR